DTNAFMHVREAWTIQNNASNVVVGLIDSGADITAPDLLYPDGVSVLITNWIDGTSLVGIHADPTDLNGHGTQMAGYIGAVTDNGEGVASIAPGVRIVLAKAPNFALSEFLICFDDFISTVHLQLPEFKVISLSSGITGDRGNDPAFKAA